MVLSPVVRLRPAGWFAVLALAAVGVEWLVIQQADFETHAALPAAVTFDLLVGLPLLFYWLVVRPYRLPRALLLGAFAGAVAVGYWLIPAPQQRYLEWARHGLVAAEALAVGLAVLNLRRLRRAFRQVRPVVPGYLEALAEAFKTVFGRPLGAMSSEVGMLYYALLSWGAPIEARPTDTVFSNYHESAVTALLVTLGLLSVVEMGAVHLLLMQWQPTAAWVVLGLHLYGLLALLAHIRAVRLRPTLLTAHGDLLVRVGFWWNVLVPRTAIAEIQALNDAPARATGVLNVAASLLTPPNLLLVLQESLVAQGPYGRRRPVRQLALYLDQPAALREALDHQLAEFQSAFPPQNKP